MLAVSELHIYPVKSLAGIALPAACITSRGLQYDRRMMLVDSNHSFLTQREYPQMALLQPAITTDGFLMTHKHGATDSLFIPFKPARAETVVVSVWDDDCAAQVYDSTINEWFSRTLEMECKLVYMPDDSIRYSDKRYSHDNEITSFADDFAMLLIGQSSLDDLNTRLKDQLPMNRFRPNIVFTGGTPFVEDELGQFSINDIVFKAVKPCARCVLTTIDQETSAKSKEPLKTLATYRQKDNKILFGQNLVHHGTGVISIGDNIDIAHYQPAAI